jgi:Flp pilus assembly protein TadD
VENVAARHALGVLAMQRGHLTEAKELLNEAEKSDPENVQVLTSRGDLCIAVREFEAAESYFRRGLAFEERNLFIHVSLVKLYIAQGKDGGDFEQAEKALAATRTINGMSDYVLTMEGQLLLAKGELEPAHKVLNRLRQLRDKPPVATLNLLGQVLCRLGKPDAARQRFEQALYQEPRNQQTYCTWADTQMAAGDFGRASELLDKATQVDDGNAYVVQCLARLEQARGECYKADELYLKAKQLGLQS